MCNLAKSCILIFVCLISGVGLRAQTGIIQGVVNSQEDGSSLPGSTVRIADLSLGTATDIDGRFTLGNVPVGKQILVISFIGYETKYVQVEVKDNEITKVDEKLGTSSILGQEVVITGQALGQAKAINQQLNSEAIVNIVSADKIQELPDVNAAEAISRLPGIAINRSGGEGQKVVVRGLDPKFSAITVNGVRLPATSGSDRSVDLSMISPEMLDGIEVFKSPMPDMDAESVGGTVNLSLRKAPKKAKFLAKALGGYNQLNDDFGDYKIVMQGSRRFLNDKLGIVTQGSVERFNRGGDIINYNWTQGETDAETGVTAIFGGNLGLIDRREIRRRNNGSLSMDYDLGKGQQLGFFGLLSQTNRDRFEMSNVYSPNTPTIVYRGQGIENSLTLYSGSFSGQHALGKLFLDWSTSASETRGKTPYNFRLQFDDNQLPFDDDLNIEGHPRNFLGGANPNLSSSILRSGQMENTSTLEQTYTAMLNIRLNLDLNKKVNGYLKIGGKFFRANRNRDVKLLAEDFYAFGGQATLKALEQFPEDIERVPFNQNLISILSFLEKEEQIRFKLEDGSRSDFSASLDPEMLRRWQEAQASILNNDRRALVDNYDLVEMISAAYVMLKINIGDRVSIIPGLRYEFSDNSYSSGISTVNGIYGMNGFFNDTTTFQLYGVLLPHLHLKYQMTKWLDMRASFSTTIARPDYSFVTPRAQINDSQTEIIAGNPNLDFAKARNVDLFFSAYKGGWGLFSIGGFYKDIENIFIPRTIQLATPELAAENGWPGRSGFQLNSFSNLNDSRVYGFEMDIQTNLSLLKNFLRGFVFNLNYARLFSTTQVFFLTSETKLISAIPPIVETVFTSNERLVPMPSQTPHVFNMSLGYDFRKMSVRVSGSYQGVKARSYSLNKDFDQFDNSFWRWDASIKQRLNKHWSIFFNINNITNQQDIAFVRNLNYIRRIETFGITSTIGIQFKL